MNRRAASNAVLPRPMPMLSESTTSMISRPPAAPALELYSSALAGTASAVAAIEMNSADAIWRGLPSTDRVKSCAVRSGTGRPFLSTTLTSTGTRSTADLNVARGGCGSWEAASIAIDSATAGALIALSLLRFLPASRCRAAGFHICRRKVQNVRHASNQSLNAPARGVDGRRSRGALGR